MARLPKYAERFFAATVSEYDGLCHQVEEDEGGWDYFVELPHQAYNGPAESQPPRQRALVQVKSILGAKTSVPITLSNLLKSAQDPGPWFIVLIKKQGGMPVLYIKHFWKDLIASSLKAIRSAEGAGAALNKRTMSIRFTDSDIISGDMIKWMQNCIDAPGDYQDEKRRFYDNVGHENGYGEVQLTFSDHSDDEIYKEFLGLGSGLKTLSFEYVPERFSLPDYSRKVSLTNGRVSITPESPGECQVRFRSSQRGPAVSITGTVYVVPFAPEAPIRVSAPPMELLFSGRQVTMSMTMKPAVALPLDRWHTCSQLQLMMMKGPLQVEVWRGNHKFKATINIEKQTRQNLDWDKLYSLFEAIQEIARDRNIGDLSFSLKDINAHIEDLGYLFQGRAPAVRFSCDASAALEPNVTSFLHYSLAELAGWTFGHLIHRTVVQDVVEGQKRIITAGPLYPASASH